MTPRRKTRFVVRRGKVASLRENRNDGGANKDIVPVPVLSGRVAPVERICLIRLRYWVSSWSAIVAAVALDALVVVSGTGDMVKAVSRGGKRVRSRFE